MAGQRKLSDVRKVKRYYTVAQVVERWQASERRVRGLIHHGTLEAFKVGRSVRIPDSALYAYERQHFKRLTWPTGDEPVSSGVPGPTSAASE